MFYVFHTASLLWSWNKFKINHYTIKIKKIFHLEKRRKIILTRYHSNSYPKIGSQQVRTYVDTLLSVNGQAPAPPTPFVSASCLEMSSVPCRCCLTPPGSSLETFRNLLVLFNAFLFWIVCLLTLCMLSYPFVICKAFSRTFPNIFNLNVVLYLRKTSKTRFNVYLYASLLLYSRPYLFPLINAIINKLHNKEEVHVRTIPKFEY